MPITPQFVWEQTPTEVFLHVTLHGVRREAVDVFLSETWVKVNAPPTYLLTLDLLHEIDAAHSRYVYGSEEAPGLHLTLRKVEPGLVWDHLVLPAQALSRRDLLARRAASLHRATADYNRRLEARQTLITREGRRLTEAQWEVERQQRGVIEARVQAERTAAEADLFAWEDASPAQATPAPRAISETACPVRHAATVDVAIDFTATAATMPTRSRGDEDYYRRSRYQPVSVEDSPLFWKERADVCYGRRDWEGALQAYSESIKRDGVFLTCIMNRAACHLHRLDYRRAIEDVSLALTVLANTPASEMTQTRYRAWMEKLHARRGAAYGWKGDLARAIADLRVAVAYADPAEDHGLAADLALLEARGAASGLVETTDPLAGWMQEAAGQYYRQDYAAAVASYDRVLAAQPDHLHAQSNRTAALLQLGRFAEAAEGGRRVLTYCGEVAEALAQSGERAAGDDSDDEDLHASPDGTADPADELVRRQREAAGRVCEGSGQVYLLLKAYVRLAAALCGLGKYREAAPFLEQAIRITPYDNDLLEDGQRLAEKIRLETLVAATTKAS